MDIQIQLTHATIPEQQPPTAAFLGAWVEFRGVVRGEEDGAPIAALEYEAYQPMAEREMQRLLTELSAAHPCLCARVIHRLGRVPVGEAAIYVGVAAKHRAEAFALLAAFMDRLKQDVPIWKRRAVVKPQPASSSMVEGSAPRLASPSHTASEVLQMLRELSQPLSAERTDLSEAAGRVLRESVCAPEFQPAFDRSAVDGYAIRLDDAGPQFRIVDVIRAGDWKPRELSLGETVRIATGGALPGSELTVVMQEDVRVEGEEMCVLRRSDDRHIRFRGEDAHAGQELVPEGKILDPGALSLLASLGCVQPLVTRLPRVLHIVTGNEIVPPGQTPAHGQIRDSNSVLVRTFLQQWQISPAQRHVAEDAELIRAALPKATQDLDLLLISGGASVGDHDCTRRLLQEEGFAILVSKTSARPGKPLIVAQRGGTIAFGLPGNPLAHFVCLHLYARAVLEGWLGQSHRSSFTWGKLTEDLAAGGNARETFWPACWRMADGAVALTPLRWQSSGDLTALAAANALVRVNSAAQFLPRGHRVEFLNTHRAG